MAHEEFRPADVQGALAHLIEECGEVLAAAGKIGDVLAAAGKTVRFGLNSVNPLIPVAERETNASWLLREMADLEKTLPNLLSEVGDLAKAIPALRTKMEDAGWGVKAEELTLAQKQLLWKMLTPGFVTNGGTRSAAEADVLVGKGYASLASAQRSPTGERWYVLSPAGHEKLHSFLTAEAA